MSCFFARTHRRRYCLFSIQDQQPPDPSSSVPCVRKRYEFFYKTKSAIHFNTTTTPTTTTTHDKWIIQLIIIIIIITINYIITYLKINKTKNYNKRNKKSQHPPKSNLYVCQDSFTSLTSGYIPISYRRPPCSLHSHATCGIQSAVVIISVWCVSVCNYLSIPHFHLCFFFCARKISNCENSK